MTTRIKIKKGAGTPSGLTFGELAYDVTNRKLFIGITGGNALLANTDGGVASFNGLTGAVTGVTVGGTNIFTALNSFNAGISAAGGTFSSQTRFLAGISAAGATFGTDISVFGIRVGRGNQGATNGGDTNLAVGANALNSVVPNPGSYAGIQNLAFGTSALQLTTSGGYNSAFGTEALYTNTSGGGNIAFGVHALRLNTSGAENCAFGGGPMYQNTTGSYNTAIGSLAYYYKSTGSYNVAIGFQAGYNFGTPRSGSTVTSATNCTLIGTYATPLTSGSSNEIVIGYDAIGKGSNTVSIGNSSITATHLTGVVNIPSGLSAAGGVTFSGTLKGVTANFTGLLSASAGISAAGTTAASFNGLVDMNFNMLYEPTLRYYNEPVSNPTITANVLTVDLSAAQVFGVTLNAAIDTFTISNTPATANRSIGFTLILTADGTARGITWGAPVKWSGGVTPTTTITNGKKDIFTFMTINGGTEWLGFIAGQNF